MRFLGSAWLSAALVAYPLAGAAHPHVFIDGGADFLFQDNALTAVRITWAYDEFTTLYYLQEMQVDPEGDLILTEAERALLLVDHVSWDDGFEGDSYLEIDGKDVRLSDPKRGSVEIRDGRLRITFERELANSVAAAGLRATARLYDPTYFVAYSVTQPSLAEGVGHACRATLVPFDPGRDLVRLQATLAQLSREETPEDTRVGALFADEIHLTCE
ncbi:MAG: DUF1007 family protein [Pseudomonadota bacterium]